jgi:hypothetical protein
MSAMDCSGLGQTSLFQYDMSKLGMMIFTS